MGRYPLACAVMLATFAVKSISALDESAGGAAALEKTKAEETWSWSKALAIVTDQDPDAFTEWKSFLLEEPFEQKDAARAAHSSDRTLWGGNVRGSWWGYSNLPHISCPYGGAMQVEYYGQEVCFGIKQGICKEGWRLGIDTFGDTTYLMLWREEDPSRPVFKWFEGATQLCIGEKYPNIAYLYVKFDSCTYFLIGPGAGDPKKLARLKIVPDTKKYSPHDVIVKFRKGAGTEDTLWRIFANGFSKTSHYAAWYKVCTDAPSVSPQPSESPTSSPSASPSEFPTSSPSATPSANPAVPTISPRPSSSPTSSPSASPSISSRPSSSPTSNPSASPSSSPSAKPSSSPSASPSASPSSSPSQSPSDTPSSTPSAKPSSHPSPTPSDVPTSSPSEKPSAIPSASPSASPSSSPSEPPSAAPSTSPSKSPSAAPSTSPSSTPSVTASSSPSSSPSSLPSSSPSDVPTLSPTDPVMSLSTTFDDGNANNGNVFTINAKNGIRITRFDVHTRKEGEYSIEVWTRKGGYSGFLNGFDGWELIYKKEDVAAAGKFERTELGPFDKAVVVEGGDSQSFRVFSLESPNPLQYTDGEGEGTVAAENGDLQILVGKGCGLTSCTDDNRKWNGVLYYMDM